MMAEAEQKIRPQYDVLVGDSIQDIRIEVQLALQGGWELQGGVHVHDGKYYQAATRYIEEIVIPSDILYTNLLPDI